MRRALYWAAVVVAVAALVGGALYAYLGYRDTSGPDGAVRGYFAAVARGDAPAALAFGDVPDGPHRLLTSTVLAEQQRIAPLHDVEVTTGDRSGDHAWVRFRYRLDFAAGERTVTGRIPVMQHDGSWRLARSAVPTTIGLDRARDRISLAGAAVPDGATLLFPGALPVQVDSSYLALHVTGDVRFGTDAVAVRVTPSAAAQSRLGAAIQQQLRTCASGAPAAADCPLPSTRIVPGTLRGRLVGPVAGALEYHVASDAAGTIRATGSVAFRGSYRELSYDNVTHVRHGTLRLPIDAASYPQAPLSVRFEEQA
jgi:hypothetical protein